MSGLIALPAVQEKITDFASLCLQALPWPALAPSDSARPSETQDLQLTTFLPRLGSAGAAVAVQTWLALSVSFDTTKISKIDTTQLLDTRGVLRKIFFPVNIL